jgi:hypothetical protein
VWRKLLFSQEVFNQLQIVSQCNSINTSGIIIIRLDPTTMRWLTFLLDLSPYSLITNFLTHLICRTDVKFILVRSCWSSRTLNTYKKGLAPLLKAKMISLFQFLQFDPSLFLLRGPDLGELLKQPCLGLRHSLASTSRTGSSMEFPSRPLF